MKEWAKEFYHSKDWISTRRAYLIAQHYLCERCGEPAKVVHHKHYLTKRNINNADIALNWITSRRYAKTATTRNTTRQQIHAATNSTQTAT